MAGLRDVEPMKLGPEGQAAVDRLAGDLPRIRQGACTHGWLRRRSQVWPYASGCLLDVRPGMGCLCDRDEGHAGRCRCACGSTSTTRREEKGA